MSTKQVFRCVLKSRPGANNEPTIDNFGYETTATPGELQEGEISIQTLYLSLDPALRCRMNDDTGVDYMRAWGIGETVLGLGGVGVVLQSKNTEFKSGDVVHGVMNWPWTTVFNANPSDKMLSLSKVDLATIGNRPQLILSALGMTGLTAYLGVVERGHLTQGANQTFVVSAAAGATGNLAGQIAKIRGCKRVVGICGTDHKCEVLTSQLGFDGAINYKTEDVAARLKELCPDGIDCYFDNVGGELSETVIKQMNYNSHVILCGQIAVYNKDVPYPPPISEEIQNVLKERNITRERFLVVRFEEKFGDALQEIGKLIAEGKLKAPEWIHEGLESAPRAFVHMMTGVNQDKLGKQMVHVSDMPALTHVEALYVNSA